MAPVKDMSKRANTCYKSFSTSDVEVNVISAEAILNPKSSLSGPDFGPQRIRDPESAMIERERIRYRNAMVY